MTELERGDEPQSYPPPLVCEGKLVPHTHNMPVRNYRYLNMKDNELFESSLCPNCVGYERERGYTLERIIGEKI